MGRTSSLQVSSEPISSYFQNSPIKSFSEKAVHQIFDENRWYWNLSQSTSKKQFISFLLDNDILNKKDLRNSDGKTRSIFFLPGYDNFTIYTGLKKGAYYTHYTAMFINELTLQIPKTNYLNYEHYQNSERGTLDQESIDKAFSKQQRKSQNTFTLSGNKVLLINGMFTDRLGVIHQSNNKQSFFYTDLERTLIDISIRPVYSGGVFEVLQAYQFAKGKLSPKILKKYLNKLDYTYPYHQVIGFYLEKAGYPESVLSIFDKNIEFNFYITYDIRIKEFSERWQLYYPKGM